MAIFQAFNAAGIGFNMVTTNSSGWAFMTADPYVTTDIAYDDGHTAIFDVQGSTMIDQFEANYWTNGYDVVVHDLLYSDLDTAILSIKGLDLHATVEDLEGNAWYVALNGGNDIFYGNDYSDLIRAGFGSDEVYGYDGDDIIYGDAGNDWLFGVDGDDDLYGGTGSDVLDGGFDSDYLSGGAGRDTLTGGEGEDFFAFDTRPTKSNLDRIMDFDPFDDTIMLDNSVFKRIGRDDKWLATKAFTTGSAARDSSDRIIYNKKSGVVLYDVDGKGGKAAIKVAQLDKYLTITADDFFVL